jgi:hypothetical protein
MIIKASGRAALILAAGLFVCFAGQSQAATSADETAAGSEKAAGAPIALHKNLRHGWHHRKHTAHSKFHGVALRTADHKQAAATDVATGNSPALSDLPLRVANANAQLPFPGAPVDNTSAMQARANDLLQAAPVNPVDARADNRPDNETLVVAADQLNDVDRALHASNSPAATMLIASADQPAAPVMASSEENSTWDGTSLIGKIFIGFGALLTMASAARMFMA